MNRERLKGHLDLLLLAVLAAGPAHGYAVISALRQRSEGTFDLPEGTVYPALHRLEDAGLLSSNWADADGRRRRVYALTSKGAAALTTEQSEWRRFAHAVQAVTSGPGLAGRPDPSRGAGMSDLVEEYLDELYSKLRGSPRQGRRLLAEAEDHLRQGVDEGLAGGLTLDEAQQHAVSSFGSVRAVVRAHDTRLRRVPGVAILADVVMAAWKLGSVGLLAIGASGLVVAAMNVLVGRSFVAAVSPGIRLPAASCRYWQSIWPSAHSCAQAYMMESSSDAVSLRVAAGLLGLLLLGGYYLAKRRGWSPGVLPDGFTPTIAVTVFGMAGLGLAWLAAFNGGGLVAVAGITGPGWYLSGAIVALAMAAGYGLNLQRTLLRHARR